MIVSPDNVHMNWHPDEIVYVEVPVLGDEVAFSAVSHAAQGRLGVCFVPSTFTWPDPV